MITYKLLTEYYSNYSRTSTNGHLPITALISRPGRRSIHLLLLKPLYSGHLSTTATALNISAELKKIEPLNSNNPYPAPLLRRIPVAYECTDLNVLSIQKLFVSERTISSGTRSRTSSLFVT